MYFALASITIVLSLLCCLASYRAGTVAGYRKSTKVADVVSSQCNFSAKEIKDFQTVCASWDATLAAVGYAGKHGYSDLEAAYHAMKQENPMLDDCRLFIAFGLWV